MDKYEAGISASQQMWDAIAMTADTPVEAPAAPAAWQAACDIAAGRVAAAAGAAGVKIRGGYRDFNSKGRGPEWYRMALRGSWTYFADERMPRAGMLASQRRCSTTGDVFIGEIIAQHDKGSPIDCAYLVVDTSDKPLKSITFTMRRDGQICFALPDGSEVIAANPRK